MTGTERIDEVISGDDRFKLVGIINDRNGTAVYFCPRKAETDVLVLEQSVRNLFCEIPEKTGIVSTHGGVVMMTCSERSSDVKIEPTKIHVQCFLSEEAALKGLKSSSR